MSSIAPYHIDVSRTPFKLVYRAHLNIFGALVLNIFAYSSLFLFRLYPVPPAWQGRGRVPACPDAHAGGQLSPRQVREQAPRHVPAAHAVHGHVQHVPPLPLAASSSLGTQCSHQTIGRYHAWLLYYTISSPNCLTSTFWQCSHSCCFRNVLVDVEQFRGDDTFLRSSLHSAHCVC